MRIFSYPSVLTFVLGAQMNSLIEACLLSTHNICFGCEIEKKSIMHHYPGDLLPISRGGKKQHFFYTFFRDLLLMRNNDPYQNDT